PDHGETGRHREHAGDELADGAAPGDAGDEDAHEGRPGDGPGPVEDGPGVLPAGIGPGVVPQRELGQGDEVVAEGLQGPLEDEQGGAAGDQHEQQQQHGHDDVEVGEDLDALLQAEGHRDQGEPADHADDDEVPDRVLRDPEQLVQAAVDLQGAQTHRDRDAEDGADDRDDVDDLADRPVDALAEQRLEDRAHARGQVALVDEVGEAQGGQGEDRPGVQREVVVGEVHGVPGGGPGAGLEAELGGARRIG